MRQETSIVHFLAFLLDESKNKSPYFSKNSLFLNFLILNILLIIKLG
ncbi:hypothetical protein D920_02912 [Enterococcus faecalis 13-SD-W-01]|nr:hypothetical protein D920_02912 [Enterococcus faecalis 13-SD-W-01]